MSSFLSSGAGPSSDGVAFRFHQHGKSKVRVGRVWRQGSVHKIVEWNVDIVLFSSAERSFTHGDNSSVVATDTMKNTVSAEDQGNLHQGNLHQRNLHQGKEASKFKALQR